MAVDPPRRITTPNSLATAAPAPATRSVSQPQASAPSTPAAKPSPFTAPAAVSPDELARDNAAYKAAIDGGAPVKHGNAEAVGFWVGVALSAPVDLAVSGQRYIGELLDSGASAIFSHLRKKDHGVGWSLLMPVAYVLQFFAKLSVLIGYLIDAPFKLPRIIARSIAASFERERPAALNEANFLRVKAWPHLPINAASEAAAARYLAGKRARFDAIIVPGFSTDTQTVPLSDDAKARLDRAAYDLRRGLAPFILVSGGNVHPAGTPYNEAHEMRRYLIEQHHVAPEQILVEPFAEHTPSNVRNAGRLMRSIGLMRGVITSSMGLAGQMHVFNRADSLLGGNDTRAIVENGTLFGRMTPVDFYHCGFFPDSRVDLVKLENGAPHDETTQPEP